MDRHGVLILAVAAAYVIGATTEPGKRRLADLPAEASITLQVDGPPKYANVAEASNTWFVPSWSSPVRVA